MRDYLAIKESCSRPSRGCDYFDLLYQEVCKDCSESYNHSMGEASNLYYLLWKSTFLVENTNHLKELELDIERSFSGRPCLDF